MIKDMSGSIHDRASRLLPLFVAFVNGMSPFAISLLIIAPIWAAHLSVQLPLPPLQLAFFIALAVLFLLGTYLGKISGMFWLWSGVRALAIALATGAIIVLLNLLQHG